MAIPSKISGVNLTNFWDQLLVVSLGFAISFIRISISIDNQNWSLIHPRRAF